MPRNFNLPPREPSKGPPPVRLTAGPRPKYWNDDTASDNRRDPVWPYYVIGAAVVLIIGVGLFVG